VVSGSADPPTGKSPVVFQDHGWRRYLLVVLTFDIILGAVLILLGIVLTAVIGSKNAPPPYLGPVFFLLGGLVAWFGVRSWRLIKRRKVSVFPDRIEVDDGRRVMTVPSAKIERFDTQPSDAMQIGLAQCVILHTTDGQAIRLPLLLRRIKVSNVIRELEQASGH
jgi:hypothetical protein